MLYTNRRQTVTDYQKFILLGFLNILILSNISDCAPLNIDQSESHLKEAELSLSSSSPLLPESISAKQTLDSGKNPSHLAWDAWLLLDNAGETDGRSFSDSANMLRRITPKSIFIAPPLPSCPDGYESDGMNRCVKNIQIDQDAHINFLLQRLNAMYANLGKPKPEPPKPSSPSQSSLLLPQATGPFQLNIPLVLDTTKNDTFNVNPNDKQIMSQDEDTIVTVYEVKDTKKQGLHEEKDDKIFFVENQSAKVDENDKTTSNDHEKLVPIVEFVQETDSNITSIVNYNVPVISMSQIQNHTKSIDANNGTTINENLNDDGLFDTRKPSNDSSISSTLVLVLAPSKLPASNFTENMALTPNTSTEQSVIMMKNDENVSTTSGNISASTFQDFKTFSTPINFFFNNSESINGSSDMKITTTDPIEESDIIDENEETTSDYIDEDEEEHDVTTDHNGEDFDTSTESEEEILKHSEAGLSVTIPAAHLKPSFNPSNEKKNITAANVSSVVIINDDFIRETTLLGLNTNGPVNISKDSKFDDSKTPNKTTNEERVVVVTPESQMATEIKYSPKDIVPIINLNNEQNTESSSITEEITTESWIKNLEVETVIPTTQIDEISLTKSDNINPVVTIEEALMDNAMNRRQQPLFTATFEIISSNGGIDNKSRTHTDLSETSEMMTASSTNMAKIIFPRDELHKGSSLTPLMNKTHSMKYIRASTPPRLENIKNNISTTPSVNKNEQVYNYEAIAPHHPNRHAYVIDDNQPVIKTINDQRLDSNRNGPIIKTTNEQRFGSNKKHNRPTFFPNNFGTSFVDSTRNYVRFPTYKRPHTRPGNVRFPSDEANSIHTSDDLKERYNHRPLALPSNRASIRTGTGGSKQSSWRLPIGRSDRQQPLAQRFRSTNTNEQRQRDRSLMLNTFWRKMPLVKDPSLLDHPTYPTLVPVATLKQHNDEQSHSSRMVNFYNEMSAYDQTRTYAQQSAIVG